MLAPVLDVAWLLDHNGSTYNGSQCQQKYKKKQTRKKAPLRGAFEIENDR